MPGWWQRCRDDDAVCRHPFLVLAVEMLIFASGKAVTADVVPYCAHFVSRSPLPANVNLKILSWKMLR